MFTKEKNECSLSVDFAGGFVASLKIFGKELVCGKTPLFSLRLRDEKGTAQVLSAYDAKNVELIEKGDRVLAKYSGFEKNISVNVTLNHTDFAEWYIDIENGESDLYPEWVNFPDISLMPLADNGGIGKIVSTYNEGALISDIDKREGYEFCHYEPEYPSMGAYWMFPNMVSSQFMLYLAGENGLYTGAHDSDRGLKCIDFFPSGGGVIMQYRTFCGVSTGEDYSCCFPFVWKPFEGSWHKGADIYKAWFEKNLPSNVKKISDNKDLPEWYKDSPFVVSYCVRGVHDMDKMDANALFPYENVLPEIDRIAEVVGSRVLVLLMHWEGTAPWAPPYVWPPFGGEKMFSDFADKLHEKGHLLGVYCSGFGYTLKSNLIDDYDNTEIYKKQELWRAMCASPTGEVGISAICPAQRSGHDICVASELGKKILDEAYQPLFESKVDYAQILDQNHGGGQYLCYSKDHGHPHAPGKWMTSTMRTLLDGWNERGKGKLFGCESASAEPFIGNLSFSDNRYELNWYIGEPIPVYQYIYHEYLRNFQGNQVSCPFSNENDTMRARMAYSFSAGDCMTVVLTPFLELMANWGCHDFSKLPDKTLALTFAGNMQRFYQNEAKEYLYDGKMIAPVEFECEKLTYPHWENGYSLVPKIYSTAWEKNGKKVQIFVNHTTNDVQIELRGEKLTIKALDAKIIEL